MPLPSPISKRGEKMGTIYQSVYLTPDSIAIDMTKDQVFSCQVQGSSVDSYQLIIKDLANTVLYDSTKISLSSVLYDKDTLNITVLANTITTTGQLKYTITTFSGTNSATTREVSFYNYATPTATLSITSPVANKQINLTTTYSQTQSVPVQSYQYFLYDSTGTTILQQSDIIYNAKLQYSFDGLLNSTTYQAQCIITNAYSQIADTGKISFNVSYSQPNINLVPLTTINSDLSAVTINIGQAIQNIGSSTGTLTYIDDFLTLGNTGLQLLDNTSTAYWSVNIPTVFTGTFYFYPNGFTSGKITRLEDNSGNYFEIGYNGSSFYVNINGYIVNGKTLALNSNPYVLGIKNSELIIQQSNVILDDVKPWWIS